MGNEREGVERNGTGGEGKGKGKGKDERMGWDRTGSHR